MKSTAWLIVGAVVVIIGIYALTSGGNEVKFDTPAESSQDAPRSGLDKANYPSYRGADLSGFATYLAKDDPNNCTASYVGRVQRAASDTLTYQPIVYPDDTSEFLALLRSACAAAGR